MTPKKFIRDIIGLPDALAGKVPATRLVAGKALSADVTLAKADVGLNLVDNTADTAKPVSTAQQAALDAKAGRGYNEFTDAQFVAGPAGIEQLFGVGRPNGVGRWRWGTSRDVEAGGNTGSNWDLYSYADTGAFYARPFRVERATSNVILAGGIDVGGTTVLRGIGKLTGPAPYLHFEETDVPVGGAGNTFLGQDGDIFFIRRGTIGAANAIGVNASLTTSFSGHLQPYTDANLNLGASSVRFATAYFATNPIVSSDARLKTVRGDGLLTEQEVRWWGRNRHRVYQYTAAVQEKGAAAARLHVGLIAQEVRDNAIKEGLDPGRYALWCEDPVLVPVTRTRSVERTVRETVLVPTEEVTVANGRAVRRTVDKSVTRDVTQQLPLFHADGKPVIIQQAVTANGVETTAAVQATYTVPVRETVLETYEEMAPTGETRLGLRYEQCLIMEAAFLRSALNLVYERLLGRQLCGAANILAPKAAAEITAADKGAADAREAARRIAALFGSPAGLEELMDKKVSASARATSLANKKASDLLLTLAEATEENQLSALFATIETIRAVEKIRAAEITAGAAVLTPWPA